MSCGGSNLVCNALRGELCNIQVFACVHMRACPALIDFPSAAVAIIHTKQGASAKEA